MNYYKIASDLNPHFYNFELSNEQGMSELFDNNIFFKRSFPINQWIKPEMHLFEELEEYLPIENGEVIKPNIWSNIVHVWGSNTFVFSQELTIALLEDLKNCGAFLEANYESQTWFFYYCSTHISGAINFDSSEYDMFDDGTIMTLHKPVLFKSKIEGYDAFRLIEYDSFLFVSEKIKNIIEKYFVGEVFTPISII